LGGRRGDIVGGNFRAIDGTLHRHKRRVGGDLCFLLVRQRNDVGPVICGARRIG
jgi:hypothetical protein